MHTFRVYHAGAQRPRGNGKELHGRDTRVTVGNCTILATGKRSDVSWNTDDGLLLLGDYPSERIEKCTRFVAMKISDSRESPSDGITEREVPF